MTIRKRHRGRRPIGDERERKDRLIQTRVPGGLEGTLKEEARKRRLSVSHLIRNVLEDTFHLVDNVVSEVDNLVGDSVDLARQVRKDAARVAGHARNTVARGGERGHEPAAPAAAPATAPASATAATAAAEALQHVLAWNEVVLNQNAVCAKCAAQLERGDDAFLGITAAPTGAATFLCADCGANL